MFDSAHAEGTKEGGPPGSAPASTGARPRVVGLLVIGLLGALAGAALGPVVTNSVAGPLLHVEPRDATRDLSVIDVQPEQTEREWTLTLDREGTTHDHTFSDAVFFDGSLYVAGSTHNEAGGPTVAVWRVGADDTIVPIVEQSGEGALLAVAQHPAAGIVAVGRSADAPSQPLAMHTKTGSDWSVSPVTTGDQTGSLALVDVMWSEARQRFVAVGWASAHESCTDDASSGCAAHISISSDDNSWQGGPLPTGASSTSAAFAVTEVGETVVVGGVADDLPSVWLIDESQSTKVMIDDRAGAVTSFIERDGHLYAAGTHQAKTGNPEFIVWHSEDGGTTWRVRFEQARPGPQHVDDASLVGGLMAFAGQDHDGLTATRGALWLTNTEGSLVGLSHPTPTAGIVGLQAVLEDRHGGMVLVGEALDAGGPHGLIVMLAPDAVRAGEPRQKTPGGG